VRERGDGDRTHNGALDNASGTAAILEIAEALAGATPRPKRSVMFVALGAEESGLLGSEHFCAQPPVPAGRIAAMLNIDGINIWGRTRDISFIGLGKSNLDEVVGAVAKAQRRVLTGDDRPDRGSFYRSDQFNFAKIGVPAVYLKAGVELLEGGTTQGRALRDRFVKERYHQPSDELDASWKLDGAVEDVQLMVVTLLRVADAPRMPAWRPGDEFEAARKKALEAR
jgi:Zn-dependent M28 family amino/carboxypeptidase